MGLDSIELLIEVEKSFDIKINDNEAHEIITVGDFYEVVWNKIKQKETNKCNSAFLFYKLREIIIEKYNIPKNEIQINTNLNLIIPEINRKIEWDEISKKLGFKLPELIFSKFIKSSLFFFGIVSIVGGLLFSIFVVNIFNFSKIYLSIPIAGIISTFLLYNILSPLKVNISGNLKEVINNTLKLNNNEISEILGTNRKEMEIVMNLLIIDRCGVDPTKIQYNSRIVKDLGIE